MKTALLQCADTGPVESLVVMLRSVGYQCYLPNGSARNYLRSIGCDTVLDIENLVRGMGYEYPMELPHMGPEQMGEVDLFVDIKAHRNYSKIVEAMPKLAARVLWYRINGGEPEHVIRWCAQCRTNPATDITERKRLGLGRVEPCPGCDDCGDEVNPPCPVLTPNQWYNVKLILGNGPAAIRPAPWGDKAYACWPPFVRATEYASRSQRGLTKHTDPVCLIHNLEGWGYGKLIEPMKKLGVKMYGRGSPDGLVPHGQLKSIMETTLAMVHLKSSDAPGYALYEALAAGCPIICSRRLIWRNRMQDLLIPGKTCLVFDRETHDPLSDDDVRDCTDEINMHLHELALPEYNQSIGEAGKSQLYKVMWSKDEPDDVASLKTFMERHYGL